MATRLKTVHLKSGAKILKTSTYVPPPRTRHIHHHHNQPSGCFPATAKVLTPMGWRPMSELEQGDHVMSYAAGSQTLVCRPVTRKLSYGERDLWQVRLAGVEEALLTTPSHKFLTDSGWKKAVDLKAGMYVYFVDEWKTGSAKVTASKASEMRAPVFNLHTAGEHNFVVDRMIAHNFGFLMSVRTWMHNLFLDPSFGGMQLRDS